MLRVGTIGRVGRLGLVAPKLPLPPEPPEAGAIEYTGLAVLFSGEQLTFGVTT